MFFIQNTVGVERKQYFLLNVFQFGCIRVIATNDLSVADIVAQNPAFFSAFDFGEMQKASANVRAQNDCNTIIAAMANVVDFV